MKPYNYDIPFVAITDDSLSLLVVNNVLQVLDILEVTSNNHNTPFVELFRLCLNSPKFFIYLPKDLRDVISTIDVTKLVYNANSIDYPGAFAFAGYWGGDDYNMAMFVDILPTGNEYLLHNVRLYEDRVPGQAIIKPNWLFLILANAIIRQVSMWDIVNVGYTGERNMFQQLKAFPDYVEKLEAQSNYKGNNQYALFIPLLKHIKTELKTKMITPDDIFRTGGIMTLTYLSDLEIVQQYKKEQLLQFRYRFKKLPLGYLACLFKMFFEDIHISIREDDKSSVEFYFEGKSENTMLGVEPFTEADVKWLMEKLYRYGLEPNMVGRGFDVKTDSFYYMRINELFQWFTKNGHKSNQIEN